MRVPAIRIRYAADDSIREYVPKDSIGYTGHGMITDTIVGWLENKKKKKKFRKPG